MMHLIISLPQCTAIPVKKQQNTNKNLAPFSDERKSGVEDAASARINIYSVSRVFSYAPIPLF